MHTHGIIDNNTTFRDGTKFFPQYLQESGYTTAFVGKWHMGGHTDSPQPGFDHWVSFAGQGHYLPVNHGKQSMLNVNGARVKQKGYITGELTDYAVDWLKTGRDADKPFFLYLSHKAVHSDFTPEEKHEKRYAGVKIPVPASQADTPENYKNKPLWVKSQRNSWHGVDFPYHSDLDVQEYNRRYYRALASVDDGIGVILDYLEKEGLMDNTVVMMMGDNGFMFGEHGLIDKRNAYEESMRVPLLVFGPGVVDKDKVVEDVVANLDIAPTILDLAGVELPPQFEGRSFAKLATGEALSTPWRDNFIYEYFWEYNYPHTPSTFAIRGAQYKYIQYYGVWDTEELYDLKADPKEMVNLIEDPKHADVAARLRQQLYEKLADGNGEHTMSYSERLGFGAVLRKEGGSLAAEFPDFWLRDPSDKDVKRHIKNEGGRRKGH
jgi:arylsulfatase A-like enzyme